MGQRLEFVVEEIKPRDYQAAAIESVEPFFDTGLKQNPVVVAPTGSGKSIIIAGIIENYIERHFPKRILVMSHVSEILEQNGKAIHDYLGLSVGTYSAGLGEKDLTQLITVANIQSINKLKDDSYFEKVGLILIDECHLVNHRNKGMYRSVLNRCPNATAVGLTATPFRLGHGYIHEGEGTFFTHISYNGGDKEHYNKLVEDGWLCKLISKATIKEIDVSKVRTTAGDFNLKDLSTAVDQAAITKEAVQEIIKYGKRYKHWLIFAIDIEHAEHICKELKDSGIPAGVVHSKMKTSRKAQINKFKTGEFRAIVNVDVLTTGFDFPGIDLIAMLRPTQSPIIHVQTAGRGARIMNGKSHCLFLDFAGNTERLGPVNDVYVRKKGERSKGKGKARTKRCPGCMVIHHAAVKVCDICGHSFVKKTKLKTSATSREIVAQNDSMKRPELQRWMDVDDIKYSKHYTRVQGAKVMRVVYHCGINRFTELIHLGRRNYNGYAAANWVRWRWPKEYRQPKDVDELFEISSELKRPKRIFVDFRGRRPKIEKFEF